MKRKSTKIYKIANTNSKKKKRKLFIIFGFILLIVIIKIITSLSYKKKSEEISYVPIEACIVKKELIRDIIFLTERLKPESEVNVFSPVPGWLDKLYVEIGSKVNKRQIVGTVDRNIIGAEYTKAVVKSPISGEVSRIFLDKGATVSPSRPIMQIVNYNKLKVYVNIPEKYVYKVKKGSPVLIYIEELPDEEFIGKIEKLSKTIDSLTGTFQALITIPNKLHKLKPGLFADIQIITEQKKALVIPYDAIMNFETDNPFVYIINATNKSVKKVYIKTGIKEKERVEVIKGLKKGDLIVLTGKEIVKEESKIKIINKKELKLDREN